jgi:hypothetical protein
MINTLRIGLSSLNLLQVGNRFIEFALLREPAGLCVIHRRGRKIRYFRGSVRGPPLRKGERQSCNKYGQPNKTTLQHVRILPENLSLQSDAMGLHE